MPAETIAALQPLQPPVRPGIRLAAPRDLHLTLHFLGEADVDAVRAAFAHVRATPISLTLSGVGQFPTANATTTLWAGIAPNAALTALHHGVAEALIDTGFVAEKRPYTPHLTLARCEPEVPASVTADFLANHEAFHHTTTLGTISLFSSRFVNGTPEYTVEASFLLSG